MKAQRSSADLPVGGESTTGHDLSTSAEHVMRRTVDFSASVAGRGSRGTISDDPLARLRFKL